MYMPDFQLDPTLEADTYLVCDMGLSRLLLMDDARFPWFILVPRRPEMREIHDLSPLDQTVLAYEMVQVSQTLKGMTNCTKINVGALGNIVRQLHVHVIARTEHDAAWPGPVWGAGTRQSYPSRDAENLVERFTAQLI